jgi:hypothetical protein
MNVQKPIPLIAAESHNVCPICGEKSYSAVGMHPQCAQRQAEEVQNKKTAADKPVVEKLPAKTSHQHVSWKKTCPKCSAEVHIRKKICSCGHAFSGR